MSKTRIFRSAGGRPRGLPRESIHRSTWGSCASRTRVPLIGPQYRAGGPPLACAVASAPSTETTQGHVLVGYHVVRTFDPRPGRNRSICLARSRKASGTIDRDRSQGRGLRGGPGSGQTLLRNQIESTDRVLRKQTNHVPSSLGVGVRRASVIGWILLRGYDLGVRACTETCLRAEPRPVRFRTRWFPVCFFTAACTHKQIQPHQSIHPPIKRPWPHRRRVRRRPTRPCPCCCCRRRRSRF